MQIETRGTTYYSYQSIILLSETMKLPARVKTQELWTMSLSAILGGHASQNRVLLLPGNEVHAN